MFGRAEPTPSWCGVTNLGVVSEPFVMSQREDFWWSIIKKTVKSRWLNPRKSFHHFHVDLVALSSGGCSAFLGKPLKWEFVGLITSTCLMTFFTCRVTAAMALSRQRNTDFRFWGFNMTFYLHSHHTRTKLKISVCFTATVHTATSVD